MREKISILIVGNDVTYANLMYSSISNIAESSDIVIASRFSEFSRYLTILNPDVIFFDYAGISDFSGIDMLAFASKHSLLSRLVLMIDSIACESLVSQTALSHVSGYILKQQQTDKLANDLLPYIENAMRNRKDNSIKAQPCKTVLDFINALKIENQVHRSSCTNMRKELEGTYIQSSSF